MYVCVHALVSSMPLQQQCFHDNNVSTCTYKITIEMKVFCLTHNCYMHSNCTNTESLHVLIATCSKYTCLFTLHIIATIKFFIIMDLNQHQTIDAYTCAHYMEFTTGGIPKQLSNFKLNTCNARVHKTSTNEIAVW